MQDARWSERLKMMHSSTTSSKLRSVLLAIADEVIK
jgi:hypothetical protein